MLLSLLLRPLVGISHSGLREKVRDNDYYSPCPIALRDMVDSRRNNKKYADPKSDQSMRRECVRQSAIFRFFRKIF
jgi:hypothetical protein